PAYLHLPRARPNPTPPSFPTRRSSDLHRRMAEELGISVGALRTRSHHIRRDLEKCVLQCANSLVTKQKTSLRALLKRRHLIGVIDRKSTRLNSSHRTISYAVFCLKKKK